MYFRIPSVGFYTNIRSKFLNIKMDKLIARMRVTIRYSSAYSPWSNGINKHNHANCDVTIKQIMEGRKVVLTDSLIIAGPWTHNTNVNKLGYTSLQM